MYIGKSSLSLNVSYCVHIEFTQWLHVCYYLNSQSSSMTNRAWCPLTHYKGWGKVSLQLFVWKIIQYSINNNARINFGLQTHNCKPTFAHPLYYPEDCWSYPLGDSTGFISTNSFRNSKKPSPICFHVDKLVETSNI